MPKGEPVDLAAGGEKGLPRRERVRAVEATLRGDPISSVAHRTGVAERQVRSWRAEYVKGGRAQLERLASHQAERAKHHFISYSRRDRRIATPIFEVLRSRGVRLWVDELALRGGTVWRTEIDDAIQTARTFIVLLSDDAARSREVRREIDVALNAGIRIVPARVRSMKLQPTVQARLGDIKCLNLAQDRANRTRQLLEAIGEGKARLVRRKPDQALDALAQSHSETRRAANRQARAVKAFLLGEPVDAVAARARTDTKTLRAWRREFMQGGRAQLGRVPARQNDNAASHHFVSASSRDRRIAGPILEELRAGGVVLREDGTSPGGDTSRSTDIDDAIRTARTFLLLLSGNSARSREVRRQIEVALEAKKDIVPAQIRPMKIPPAIIRLIGNTQIVNLTKFRRERVGLLLEAMGEMNAPILPPHEDRSFRRNVERISEALVPSDSPVILTAKGDNAGNAYVQFLPFAIEPGDPFRGEAVGDRNLEPDRALSDQQKARLAQLGWRKPGKETAGNYWRDWSCTLDAERRNVAAIAVRTLVDVYGHDPLEDVGIRLV